MEADAAAMPSPTPPTAQPQQRFRRLPCLFLRPASFVLTGTLLACTACSGHHRQRSQADAETVDFIIESSPNNLDLRQGTDAQSERVGAMIYDALVRKNARFELEPWLATAWEQPDPLTWIFHIRDGVRFHDGKPLTAEDVAWSMRSMMDGTLVTAKGGALTAVASVQATDPHTVIVRMKHADNALLFNLSDGLFGVVERGAGKEEGQHPVGTGPFRFVSQTLDRDVVLERNATYWAGPSSPTLRRVRFDISPDTITTALELKNGSGDVESNVITQDMVHALRGLPNLVTESAPGSFVIYANFNVTDPALADKRVRQAIACAIDKKALIDALWRGEATPADTLLPPGHWARATGLPQYPRDVKRAVSLLEAAGKVPDAHGIRLRFTLKTSTDETTRLEAQVIQQQLREAGIELTIRSTEFGTFYSDITKGAFQMYILRWIGSNEDPDIFRYAYASASFPPKGANRGRYANPRLDALVAAASVEPDATVRRQQYVEVQQILADELPGIPLFYPNNAVVHSSRMTGLKLAPDGSFDFLRTAILH